ncbi:MAG: hypothetical protein ABIO92_05525 [Chloroflexia bacterium]
MEKKTVRAFYDDGEVRFLDPVHVEGCWNLEITFVEQVDDEGVVFESDPHRPKVGHQVDRLEELHRQMEDSRPQIGPI